MRGEEWSAEARRAIAAGDRQKRNRCGKRKTGIEAIRAGMVRILPPAKQRPAEAGRHTHTEYLMTNKDQVDAAAREAAQRTRAGGPQRKRLDLSEARVTGGKDSPPVADELFARFQKAISTTRLDACEHVKRAWESGSATPIHWAVWRPDRAACDQCFQQWLVPDLTGHATTQFCDLCGSERPTDYIQLTRGPIIVHADVCDSCRDTSRPGGLASDVGTVPPAFRRPKGSPPAS